MSKKQQASTSPLRELHTKSTGSVSSMTANTKGPLQQRSDNSFNRHAPSPAGGGGGCCTSCSSGTPDTLAKYEAHIRGLLQLKIKLEKQLLNVQQQSLKREGYFEQSLQQRDDELQKLTALVQVLQQQQSIKKTLAESHSSKSNENDQSENQEIQSQPCSVVDSTQQLEKEHKLKLVTQENQTLKEQIRALMIEKQLQLEKYRQEGERVAKLSEQHDLLKLKYEEELGAKGQLEANLNECAEKLRRKHQKQCEDLVKEVQERCRGEYSAEIDKYELQIQQLRQQLQEEKKKFVNVQEELQQLQNEKLDNYRQIELLRTQNDSLEQHVKDQNLIIQSYKQFDIGEREITALKKELKRKDAKIDLMEAELETQKQTINELEYTIKELNAAFQQQKSQLLKVRVEDKKQIEQCSSNKQQELKMLKSEMEGILLENLSQYQSYTIRLEKLEVYVKKLEEEREQQMQNVQDLREENQIKQNAIKELELEMQNVIANFDILKDEEKKSVTEKKKLLSKIQEMEHKQFQQIEQSRKELFDYSQHMANIKQNQENIRQLERKQREWEKQHQQQQQLVEDLKGEVELREREIKQKIQAEKHYQEEVERLHAQLLEMTGLRSQLENTIEEIQKIKNIQTKNNDDFQTQELQQSEKTPNVGL